jgi:DNA helicase IV
MDQQEKDQLRDIAESDIKQKATVIGALVEKLDLSKGLEPELFLTSESETAFEDEMRSRAATANTTQIREEMAALALSPYFSRLDIAFADAPLQPYYIAKYSASDLGIYSWTAPIAALRFEEPGTVSYQTPRHGPRQGQLSRRDQYMIALGHLNFMTTETLSTDRQLVYQEHFQARKTGFVLPEVVEQMEKAQDMVIRAGHRGPFAISGPAGSGKTTLALHRVAFLRQTPETTELYPAESILILVQDNNTEDYFSHLLPELGIRDVVITTFARWAIEKLGLGRFVYHARHGRNEAVRDAYEWAKVQALHGPLTKVTKRDLQNPAKLLMAHYQDYLDEGQMSLLRSMLDDSALDRYDLTLLLSMKQQLEGALLGPREVRTFTKGRLKNIEIRQVPLEYSLILIDEFQNYMPKQLRLIRGTANKLRSMIYVGDMAQQTQFGTISQWSDIGETVAPERAINLEKVYRNTRQILMYIRSLGYEVHIPTQALDGPPVKEYKARDVVESLQYITGLTRVPGQVMGIIAKDPRRLETYSEYFAGDDTIKCLTMREAQGVEFDVVCLIMDDSDFEVDGANNELAAEQRRINRDLLYVALTRAMSELHVLGLSNIQSRITSF